MFKTGILGYILTNPFSRVRQETSSRLDPNIDGSYSVFIDGFAHQPGCIPRIDRLCQVLHHPSPRLWVSECRNHSQVQVQKHSILRY